MDEAHKILVVDDEAANLQKLRRTFVQRYPVIAAQSGREALEYLARERDVAVIIADQRMPDMTGIELLRRTLEPLPHAIRIILTGFTDVDVLMEAINSCKVFRYIVKPWDPPDLLMTVERGLEAYELAVENERFRKELIRRERMARELEIAREIQRYILPSRCPLMEDYEMAAEYHPAQEVGGDLYDFDCDPGCEALQVVIGDVSGKSIPAALYGAVFSGQIRTQFAHSMAPAETLRLLNSNLVPRYQVNNYIAVAYLHLKLKTGDGRLANAGMPYPYVVRDGSIIRLSAAGVPLGLMEETEYDELEFRLDPGNVLILASDGVTDAMNPAGQMYDEARFQASLAAHANEPIAQCVKNLYRNITEFTQNAEVHDDITILGIRRRN
jgi:sigma-B regulation protein RsbU (phosphoserine phosphatase)